MEKDPALLEKQIIKLKKELILEKELVGKLQQTQRDWSELIEKVQPTIKALSEKTRELKVNLHLKNQELSNVLQSLSNGLIVTDLQGSIQTFNRAAAAITGIEKEEALNQPINKLIGYQILPEQLDETRLEQISRGNKHQFSMIRADKKVVIIETSTTLMESDDNERQGIIFNLVDVTQLRRLEEEAERKNRMTAMGEIAMQVAHEIRNPLGSIELFVSMMKMDIPEESEDMALLQHISSATRSMNHIISNLLEYTKPRPIVLDEVDLHQLLDDFVGFSKFSADQLHISIQLQLNATDYKIQGNEELIKQVFHNLFVNACQAMPEGGNLEIITENYVETDSVILERFNANRMLNQCSLKLIRITFQDTGRGMTEAVRKKIFDPFFTTREQGTGLGLSIVHKTMASHGGTILVDSADGKGTCFTLLFPE